MDSLIGDLVRSMGLTGPLNSRRIYAAWDDATGAGPFTLKKFYRSGTLYITLNSSVIRNQLSFQKEGIIEKINSLLNDDPLFTKPGTGSGPVKTLVLK